MANKKLIIVTDFDGTLTKVDIGDELCKKFIAPRFAELSKNYQGDKMTLVEMQTAIWNHFPASKSDFENFVSTQSELREGVNDFFENCADQKTPVYIASCGLRPYIDQVLREQLSPKAQTAIVKIFTNEFEFTTEGTKYKAARNLESSPYSLDKGQVCEDVRKTHSTTPSFIVSLGNGKSDRSFIQHCDLLFATDNFAKFCEKESVSYKRFDDFTNIKDQIKSNMLN